MNITLKQAFSLLSNAGAISLDINGYDPVLYPRLIQDEDEKFFMQIEWENEGQTWNFNFPNETNQNVQLEGSSLFLKDEDGEDIQISLMKLWDVEDELENGAFMLEEEDEPKSGVIVLVEDEENP
jgi:hypothetical protein